MKIRHGVPRPQVPQSLHTSSHTLLWSPRRNHDPVIAKIEQRLSMWSQLPPSHQEDMQVLRYGERHAGVDMQVWTRRCSDTVRDGESCRHLDASACLDHPSSSSPRSGHHACTHAGQCDSCAAMQPCANWICIKGPSYSHASSVIPAHIIVFRTD